MKKWVIAVVSITLCVCIRNDALATQDVNIYNEEPEIVNEGKMIFQFIGQDTDSIETQTNKYPIENVEIELYYKVKREMHNVNNIDEFKTLNLNLKSDKNGLIVLSNLPYGMYQYKIVSAPKGFTYSDELKYIELNLLDKTVTSYEYLKGGIEIVDGEQVPENKNEETKPDNTILPEDNIIQEENKIEVNKNIDISKTNVNNLALEIYTSSNDDLETKVEEKEVMKKVSHHITKKAEKRKVDMIEEMRKVKITDTIRAAVIQNNTDTLRSIFTIADLPSKDKYKKCRIKITTTEKYINKKQKFYKRNISNRILSRTIR